MTAGGRIAVGALDLTGFRALESPLKWSSFWEKEKGTVAFEVPEGAGGLVFHDGNEHAYPIKPDAAGTPATGSAK